jgi:hypothetical protein
MLATRESTELERFHASFNRLASTRLSPSLAARMIARLCAGSLDAMLVAGADPASSSSLAARSAMITSRRRRAGLADGLTKLVDCTRGRQRRWWAVQHHGAIRSNAETLTALADLLRSQRPLHARGIAMLTALLTDGCGPCYHGDAASLADRLHAVLRAMDGSDVPGSAEVSQAFPHL